MNQGTGDDSELARRVSHIAHELRTPLVATQALLLALRGGPLETGQRDLVEEASSSIDAMLRIVKDVLALGRGSDAAPEVVESELDVARCARRSARLASEAAGGTRVDVVVAADVSGLRRGDGARIQQILLNLIGNAIKFSRAQPVELRVRAEPHDLVVFDVIDLGPGIPERERQSVFRPYARGSAAHGVPGLGVGLSISRRLAEAMGGSLTPEPSEVGARVVLRVPLRSASPVAPELPRLPTLQILLADDDAASRLIGKRVLESAGHRVDCFADGESALAGAKAADYDVLLLDVNMPRLGAPELAAALRAGGHDVPIVALTASEDPGTIARLATHDVRVIPKPFELGRVIDAIAAARAR